MSISLTWYKQNTYNAPMRSSNSLKICWSWTSWIGKHREQPWEYVTFTWNPQIGIYLKYKVNENWLSKSYTTLSFRFGGLIFWFFDFSAMKGKCLQTEGKRSRKIGLFARGLELMAAYPKSCSLWRRRDELFPLPHNPWMFDWVLECNLGAWKCKVLDLECKEIFNSHAWGDEGSRWHASWEPLGASGTN